jgi:hypothetical protein
MSFLFFTFAHCLNALPSTQGYETWQTTLLGCVSGAVSPIEHYTSSDADPHPIGGDRDYLDQYISPQEMAQPSRVYRSSLACPQCHRRNPHCHSAVQQQGWDSSMLVHYRCWHSRFRHRARLDQQLRNRPYEKGTYLSRIIGIGR